MEVGEFVAVLARLVLGAVGTFLAILVWSRTRDAAWVLIVVGTLVSYVAIVYAALQLFGIIVGDLVEVRGLPVVRIGLENLPMLLYMIGFIVVVRRARGRVSPRGKRARRRKAAPTGVDDAGAPAAAEEPEPDGAPAAAAAPEGQ